MGRSKLGGWGLHADDWKRVGQASQSKICNCRREADHSYICDRVICESELYLAEGSDRICRVKCYLRGGVVVERPGRTAALEKSKRKREH